MNSSRVRPRRSQICSSSAVRGYRAGLVARRGPASGLGAGQGLHGRLGGQECFQGIGGRFGQALGPAPGGGGQASVFQGGLDVVLQGGGLGLVFQFRQFVAQLGSLLLDGGKGGHGHEFLRIGSGLGLGLGAVPLLSQRGQGGQGGSLVRRFRQAEGGKDLFHGRFLVGVKVALAASMPSRAGWLVRAAQMRRSTAPLWRSKAKTGLI